MDSDRRLAFLASREDTLTPSERDELNQLLTDWEERNNPLNFPPPDAGLLCWSQED